MATISDLRAAIAQIVGGILYPAGVPAGTTPASPVVGCPVRVFQGWPERQAIDADMAAGIVDVSVYTMPGSTNTSRYPIVDVPISVSPPTLVWTVGARLRRSAAPYRRRRMSDCWSMGALTSTRSRRRIH